ncbi:hypothetical protein FQN50_001961 [Emmonsiellopsis sp. PD_5]|nr:hypothetical protein FQN50_001961 [Emmonsiellopsis sp. PD_5]
MHLTHPLTTLLIGLAAATPIAGAPTGPQPATGDVAKRLPDMVGGQPAEALINKRLENSMLDNAKKDRNTENDESGDRDTVGSMSGGSPIKQRNVDVTADVNLDGTSVGVDLRRGVDVSVAVDGTSIGTGIERRALLGGLMGHGSTENGKEGKTSTGLLGDILGRRGSMEGMWASKDEADAAPLPKVEKRIGEELVGGLVKTATKTVGGVLNGRGVADAQWAASDEADAPARLPKAEKRLVGELVNGVLGAVTGKGATLGGRNLDSTQLLSEDGTTVIGQNAGKRFVPELLGSVLGGDGEKGQEKGGKKGGKGEKGEGGKKKGKLDFDAKLDKWIDKQVEKGLDRVSDY